MKEEVRDPLTSKVEVVYGVNCTMHSRVWGELEVWNKEVGKQST